jgi:D-threo-aldose 1-dehydrogenase
LPALAELRAAGVVSKIGVGSMSASAIATTVLQAELDVVMVAGRLTLLDQSAALEAIPACIERGVDVVAASVFNSGILARAIPSDDDRYEYGILPENLRWRLAHLRDVCASYGVPVPAAALQYPLRVPAVRSIVIGASRPEQVKEAVDLVNYRIPEDFWAQLSSEGLTPVG